MDKKQNKYLWKNHVKKGYGPGSQMVQSSQLLVPTDTLKRQHGPAALPQLLLQQSISSELELWSSGASYCVKLI